MSDAWRVIVMMYAPSDSCGMRAIIRNVSSTSITSGSPAKSAGTSGRDAVSSLTRNSTRRASFHSAYEPSPRAAVITARALV